VVLIVYGSQLLETIADWRARGRVSQLAVADLQREARLVPEGTVIVVGAPETSWAWALPFAAKPPYVDDDLTARVSIISPRALYCCPEQWPADTRRLLREWSAEPDRQVLALRWDPRGGALSRLSDRQNPDLRTLLTILADTPSADALDENLQSILHQLVVPYSQPERVR
jgi:hypothetical protein